MRTQAGALPGGCGSWAALLLAFGLCYLLLVCVFPVDEGRLARLEQLGQAQGSTAPHAARVTTRQTRPPPEGTASSGVTVKQPAPPEHRQRQPSNGGAAAATGNPPPATPDSAAARSAEERAVAETLFRNYGKAFLLRKHGNRPPPPLPEDPLWAPFVASACGVDQQAAARRQLRAWAEVPITLRMLDNLYCIRKHTARVSIVGGRVRIASYQLSMDYDRMWSAAWLLRVAVLRAEARGEPIPDVEFLINPTDKTSGFARGRAEPLSAEPLPLFCNAACDGDASISFPLMFHAQFGATDGQMDIELYTKKHAALARAGTLLPWEAKRDRLFFSATNYRGSRARLFESRLARVHALPTIVPITEYGRYRYLIYAVGHSGWSQRLRELAFMDAVVLAQNSSCHEFYHAGFEAWRHFVPVADDLSDFEARLGWAVEHPDEARAMVREWRAHGPRALSLPCVVAYVDALLREYAGRQAFAPAPRPGWPEFVEASNQSYFHTRRPPPLATCRDFL